MGVCFDKYTDPKDLDCKAFTTVVYRYGTPDHGLHDTLEAATGFIWWTEYDGTGSGRGIYDGIKLVYGGEGLRRLLDEYEDKHDAELHPKPKPSIWPTFKYRRYQHEQGNPDCNVCWGEYPKPCECGGLVHAEFDEYEDNGDIRLRVKCDHCSR